MKWWPSSLSSNQRLILNTRAYWDDDDDGLGYVFLIIYSFHVKHVHTLYNYICCLDMWKVSSLVQKRVMFSSWEAVWLDSVQNWCGPGAMDLGWYYIRWSEWIKSAFQVILSGLVHWILMLIHRQDWVFNPQHVQSSRQRDMCPKNRQTWVLLLLV